MATMETISEALKLVDVKKENLRKAFEELHSHSSSLSSFTLTWSDLDSHFSSLQSSLEHKFKLLQSQPSDQPQPQPQPQPHPQPKTEPEPQIRPSDSSSVPARPELRSFCEKMDGLGLRGYIMDHRPNERGVIGTELPDAFRSTPDAAAMVLDAIEGFFVPNSNGDKDPELLNLRRACIVIFDGLMGSHVEIGAEVKERAKHLAVECKGKVSVDGNNSFEAFGFLYLVANYGLVEFFSADDLIDFAVVAAKFRQAVQLFRVLCFGNKMSDLIQKLISKGKQLLAVKFILEFELADKFPPVPLLKEYVKDSKKLAQKTRKDGKLSFQSLNEATTKEVSALKNVINIIEDYNVESEFFKENLMKRIESLEKEKSNRKNPAAALASKPKQQSKPQNLRGAKRPRATSPAQIPKSVAIASSTVFPIQHAAIPYVATARSTATPFQQSYVQPTPTVPVATPRVPTTKSLVVNASSTGPTFQQSYLQLGPGGQATIPDVASASPTVPAYQQSYFQHTPDGQATISNVATAGSAVPASYLLSASLLPNHHAQYMSSQAAPYGSADSNAMTPYVSSNAGLYGSAGASLGIPGSLTPAQPHAYASESSMPSIYHDGSVSYGGYGMPPKYHPSYHP